MKLRLLRKGPFAPGIFAKNIQPAARIVKVKTQRLSILQLRTAILKKAIDGLALTL
jgi:hypothetical protein